MGCGAAKQHSEHAQPWNGAQDGSAPFILPPEGMAPALYATRATEGAAPGFYAARAAGFQQSISGLAGTWNGCKSISRMDGAMRNKLSLLTTADPDTVMSNDLTLLTHSRALGSARSMQSPLLGFSQFGSPMGGGSVLLSHTTSVSGLQQGSLLGLTARMTTFQEELVCYLHARDALGVADPEEVVESSEARLARLFTLITKPGEDTVSLKQLQAGWQKLGWAHSEKALAQMFHLAGSGRDRIDRKTFNRFFRELASVEDLANWDPDNEQWLLTRIVRRPRRGRQYDWGDRPVRDWAIRTHTGLGARVKSLALDHSRRQYVACSCSDPLVRMYDLEQGRPMRSYVGHKDAVMSCAISPDLKTIVTGGRDHNVVLWELVTGHLLHCITTPGIATCVCFSLDGKSIVTGGVEGVCCRYQVKGGKLRGVSEELGPGVVVTLAHADRVVATSLSNRPMVFVLDSKTLQRCKTLFGHSAVIWSLCFGFRPDLEERERDQQSQLPELQSGREKAAVTDAPRDARRRSPGIRGRDAQLAAQSARQLVTVCKMFVKAWDCREYSLLHTFSVPTQFIGLNPRRRRWICASYLGGDFGHIIVASLSDNYIAFLREPPKAEVLVLLPTKSPVYCFGTSVDWAEVVAGDEYGNVYHVALQ
eukprot:TRINITY_DN21875_c0_g1_i1.p1 TRINITY_DN21875_c0_g1~~TRINITY_DN21875_c0_g1_i1.p1  ORF type:complete len:648 (+),score=173.23 TRINITY_DN21875_c0_g1_i1:120-2063(+)